MAEFGLKAALSAASMLAQPVDKRVVPVIQKDRRAHAVVSTIQLRLLWESVFHGCQTPGLRGRSFADDAARTRWCKLGAMASNDRSWALSSGAKRSIWPFIRRGIDLDCASRTVEFRGNHPQQRCRTM